MYINIFPKKLQFAAYGQFVLVFDNKPVIYAEIFKLVDTMAASKLSRLSFENLVRSHQRQIKSNTSLGRIDGYVST